MCLTREQTLNNFTPDHILDSAPFLLSAIDLYNWGPFGGRHEMAVHPQGTAIIGPTGSGKTTIVDALLTLIVAQPRYNLASSGGLESDRSLVAYVRGITGGGDELSDPSQVARKGKTVTGIAATFSSQGQQIQIGAIIWIDSSSSANADRKDLWIFSENPDQRLDEWLTAHHEGGARRLKQLGRETAGIRVFETRKSYLAHIRRFFEVSDNAFNLLNRAAGLKQLNSVDEIFREWVLDDNAKFDRALEVAKEFDDLTGIHAELLTAREQHASLAPLQPLHSDYIEAAQSLEDSIRLEQLLSAWFASQGELLWQREIDQLNELITTQDRLLDEQEKAGHRQQEIVQQCYTDYLKLGGDSVEHLKVSIGHQRRFLTDRRENLDQFTKLAGNLGIEVPEQFDEAAYRAIHATCNESQQKLEPVLEEAQAAVDHLRGRLSTINERLSELKQGLADARSRPDSNIPPAFQHFRESMAEALSLEAGELPFLAELIEVKGDEHAWRGAIERALGAHRLRVLVPSTLMQDALEWVNARDNRLHVRLLAAEDAPGTVKFLSDGFANKLNFKPHRLRDAMKKLLADIDRHCVENTEILRETPFAMTREGTLSGRAGQFEKRDDRALTDNWLTGFSNRDLLDNLQHSMTSQQQEITTITQALKPKEDALRKYRSQSDSASRLLEEPFDKMDVLSASAELENLETRLDNLTKRDSEMTSAKAKYDEALRVQEDIRHQIQQLSRESGELSTRLESASAEQTKYRTRDSEPLDDDQTQFVSARVSAVEKAAELVDAERTTMASARQDSIEYGNRVNAFTEKLVRQMEKAKRVDTGALTDYATEMSEIPAFLERLTVLEKEALPAKLKRFMEYLNQASDQGVVQLLAEIDAEVGRIEDRIEDLNQTLRRVDYQEGNFLQLAPSRVRHESLHTLDQALNRLRRAKLSEDDQGEAQYAALQELVGLLREASANRSNLRSRALLDPRYRLHFAYEVVKRESNEIIDRRTSSKGGSGGEKEIIASYILTASLAYALCPDGMSRPRFGTVILDEAFSKSSQAVAGRIVTALKEFGLHALFVTPNKELQLLRQHTRAAVLVHRKGSQATLTPLSWREIDVHASAGVRQPS